MLFSEDRHESVTALPWDEGRARQAIQRIVDDTEQRFSPATLWPMHPLDSEDPSPMYLLYFGACGIIWALRYLQTQGAASLARDYEPFVLPLLERNRVAMKHAGDSPFSSYMMGDTSIRLLSYWYNPCEETALELARLIRANVDHPTRELMWGSPGTLLAAWLMHQHTQEPRWAELFQLTARKLWSQLEWSSGHGCHYWTQEMYGERSTYLDAVHGFVATALPLIRGRHLLPEDEWEAWRDCIANTIQRTAEREGDLVNWRAWLSSPRGSPKLVQFCHGAPGFVICLANFPGDSLDELLVAAGETTWVAGPLRKGSNLCHGTAGNGYAFLKLYRRFGDEKWLKRARAFAMHGIAQTEQALATHGKMRYSLWTGDPGFAIYLWDCIRGGAEFPTLDTFFG